MKTPLLFSLLPSRKPNRKEEIFESSGQSVLGSREETGGGGGGGKHPCKLEIAGMLYALLSSK